MPSIGRTAGEVFPPALAGRIMAQDRAVLEEGRVLKGELELHLYPGGREGWCDLPASVLGEMLDLAPVDAERHPPAPIARVHLPLGWQRARPVPVVTYPATAGGAKCGSSSTARSATVSPSRSAAGTQPEPMTRATSCWGTPVRSASTDAASRAAAWGSSRRRSLTPRT